MGGDTRRRTSGDSERRRGHGRGELLGPRMWWEGDGEVGTYVRVNHITSQ